MQGAPWGKRRGLEDADGRDREYPLACHLCDAAAAALSLWEDHTAPVSASGSPTNST